MIFDQYFLYSMNIISFIEKVHFCGSKSDNSNNSASANNDYNPYAQNPEMQEIPNEDDLPFWWKYI